MNTKDFSAGLDDKLFSNKVYKKLYVFYSFWLVLSPMLETIFGLFGLKINAILQIMLISTLFAITKILELAFNFKNIKLKNKTIVDLLICLLLAWFILSSIINRKINVNFVYGLCYFLVFALLLSLDKKFYKSLAFVFVCEMVFDTILGFADLECVFIPGFISGDEPNYVMSMQFLNPNWSGVVVIIATMLAIWFLMCSKEIWKKILYFICFVILSFGLFLGGSYAPETALFLCELALLIYLWVKTKKCPWLILSVLLTTIFLSFAVWFIPKFGKLSTANANYFYETLAVIDGKLHTHLVKYVSTFFNKIFGWGVIDSVAGSDGWGRNDLLSQAFGAITASPKSFIFGYGSAFIYQIRVHNCYVVMWLEFGIVGFALYLAIIVSLIISFTKAQKSDLLNVLFMIFCMLLFETMFCCIEPICFVFFVMLVSVFYKEILVSKMKK